MKSDEMSGVEDNYYRVDENGEAILEESDDFLRDEKGEIIVDDDSINDKAIVPQVQIEPVETEIIEDEIRFNALEQEQQEIIKDGKLQNQKNAVQIYNNHDKESLNNNLGIQRRYEKGIDNNNTTENIKNHKANIENGKYNRLEEKSKALMLDINDNKGICLCKIKDKYYYRVNADMNFDNGLQDAANDYISNATNKLTKIISYKEIINKGIVNNDKIYTYILDHHIPIVAQEVFNPKEDEIFESSGLLYKNLFQHTKYLKKRLQIKRGN